MIEIVANLHMHTPYSDGEWFHRDIAAAAARAGIQVICVTDHNVHVGGIEGYYDGVLVLVGEEVHDYSRRPQVNHLLAYHAEEGMSSFAQRPQKLIDAIHARNGTAFAAHPIEFASPLDSELDKYPWVDWDVRALDGIELWNYMTEWKRSMWLPLALVAFLFPSLVICGPFKQTLKLWDSLIMRHGRMNAIGNSDAHGITVQRGPVHKRIFDYDYLFRCVNTHLLIERPLTRDFVTDKKMVLDALRAGRAFIGYDLGYTTRGFSFEATSGAARADMGDEFKRRSLVNLDVHCPAAGSIRLIKDGSVVASAIGRSLHYQTTDPGSYRVEVYRFFRLWQRGWIFSNPIYVR